MSHTQWGAERTVVININGGDVQVIEIAETAKPYDDFSTIGYTFSSEHAEMITKAVNSHQAMREALEAIVARIDGVYDNPSLIKQGLLSERMSIDVLCYAKKALTLANGGKVEDTIQGLINQVRHLHD